MSFLITGGAGYIGSHVNKLLSESGYDTIVYDNLSGGHREVVKWGRFVEGDIGDGETLGKVIRENGVTAVFHFASYLDVTESVTDPAKYYQNNVINTFGLLEAMRGSGCDTIIFSSTCATYGEPREMPINEATPQKPINPYGMTKLVIERMFQDYAAAYRLKYVVLRYFNAAGADPAGEIGEWHTPEPHIIPRLLDVTCGRAGLFKIFGADYPTRDGTCVRDYIHVSDLADAHLLAIEYLHRGNPSDFFNLGNASGTSNLEIVDSVRRVTGMDIAVEITARRPGDPPVLVGDSRKANRVLGWQPRYTDIDTIIRHAWNWHLQRQRLECGAENRRV